MLNFRRFALRNNSRRRAALVLPRAAEVCESRVLLSGAPVAEVVAETTTEAAEAAVPIAEEIPMEEPVVPEEEPGELPSEDIPGEETGSEFPTEFVEINSRMENGNLVITGTVNSLNGGDTIVFNVGGNDVGTANVDADGTFSFTFFLPPTGVINSTAFDSDGNEGQTESLLIF